MSHEPSSMKADQQFLFRSTQWTILGTALKVVSPILIIMVVRVFGKEAFGIYISTQLMVLVLSRIAVLGLDKGLHWYLPQNRIHERPAHEGIMESAWRAMTIAALLTVILVVGAACGLHRNLSSLVSLAPIEVSIYMLSLVPWVVIHVMAGALEGNRQPYYKILIGDFAVYSLAPMISIGLFWLGLGTVSLPLGLLGANLGGAAVLVAVVHRQFPGIGFRPAGPVQRALLRYALPLGFSQVVVAFLLRTDLWMVLVLLGPADAGVYAVMLTISNALRTIRQSFAPILLPVVAGMSDSRLRTDLKPVFSYCVSMVTSIQLVIGCFIVLFPKETLLIAGRAFVIRPEVLGILLFGNLVSGLLCLSAAVINGLGKSRFMLAMNAASLAVAILANILLIPRLGIAGAALATVSFQVMQAVWLNVYLVKIKLWPYRRSLLLQGGWIALLLGLFVATNTVLSLTLWQRIACFAGFIVALSATLLAQGIVGRRPGLGKGAEGAASAQEG